MEEREPVFSSSEELKRKMGDWTKPMVGEELTEDEKKQIPPVERVNANLIDDTEESSEEG